MASRLKTSQRFLPQRFHFNIMYRYPVSFNNGASSIGFSFIFSGLFFSKPGASLLDYIIFSVWTSTIQKNGWPQKMQEEQKFNIIMPLRPISFLSSSLFFCAWSHFIELAVAARTAHGSPALPFSFCFLFLIFRFLLFSRMLLLSHKTPSCCSARWIPRSHEPKKRIAQRTSTHEKCC